MCVCVDPTDRAVNRTLLSLLHLRYSFSFPLRLSVQMIRVRDIGGLIDGTFMSKKQAQLQSSKTKTHKHHRPPRRPPLSQDGSLSAEWIARSQEGTNAQKTGNEDVVGPIERLRGRRDKRRVCIALSVSLGGVV